LADSQYLRIQINKAEYFLPSGTSVAIEKREALLPDNSESIVSAWRQTSAGRWPAYCVDEDLIPSPRKDWVRAVFVQAKPHPIGIIGDEIQLLNVDPLDIGPFTPLGPPATSVGHLFVGAYIRGDGVAMILNPQALVAYLTALGS
jgi:hypothetical protein